MDCCEYCRGALEFEPSAGIDWEKFHKDVISKWWEFEEARKDTGGR